MTLTFCYNIHIVGKENDFKTFSKEITKDSLPFGNFDNQLSVYDSEW